MLIEKPKIKDLEMIRKILEQWAELEEVDKYLSRINSEINGQTEYSMNFWVIKDQELVIGVGGLAKPLPFILSLATTNNPGEIKILYIDDSHRGKGVGKQMIKFLEQEAEKLGYTELFIRSAEKYKNTAYDFYERMGYEELCKLENNMSVFYKVIK
ncbi:MAG: GNAT family N-acetyltransferase [Patescibacteria group bacterium]|jgi:GNAT superfamily N-acetyltransferase